MAVSKPTGSSPNNRRQTTSPRSQTTTAKAASAKEDLDNSEGEIMSVDSTAKENGGNTDKEAVAQAQPLEKGILQLHQPVAELTSLPVMSDDIEIMGTMTIAGVRPVAASHLDLVGSFSNGRPISASHLKVERMLPGNRPIFASELTFVEEVDYLGYRPILASSPALMQSSTLPGNRPIASNNVIDPDPTALMGYLD